MNTGLHLRAFIVIFSIGLLASYMFKNITKDLITTSEFKQWRNSWLFIFTSAFLSFNFWIFGLITFVYLAIQQRKSQLAISLYCALLFIVPIVPANLPGLGLMNYFMEVNYPRILTIFILFPVFFMCLTSKKYVRIGKYSTDLFIISFFLLDFFLELRDRNFTEALRGLAYHFIDIFVPYYVVSRTVLVPDHFKKVISALFFAFIVAGSVGIFEYLKGWLLYNTLDSSWGLHSGYGNYLYRGNSLRASSSFGHALVFSYVSSIVIGFYLYLNHFVSNNFYRKVGWLILFGSIIATMSRGGWVSAVIVYTVFLLSGKNPIGKLIRFFSFLMVGISLLAVLVGTSKIINLIPFIGKVDTNVEYRQQIIEVSMNVIAKNPIFGATNFINDPDLQVLIQGEQIIDMLNTYINVTLANGYVGLFLFVGIFITALLKLFQAIRKYKKTAKDNPGIEMHILGRVLFACLIATMFTIGSSGFGGIVPTVFALLIGLSVAYCKYINSVSN